MNINPVSFKGTFAVPRLAYQKNYRQLLVFSEKNSVNLELGTSRNQDTLYIHSPYEKDEKTFKFLKRHKIPFNLLNEQECMTNKSINSRIVLSYEDEHFGNILADVNTKKLDKELSKNKDSYVGINGQNGSKEKYNRFKRYLKTNQPIDAPSIYLRKRKDGSIVVEVKDGRHRFAVLRDMGLENMKISIEKKSIELAKEINLI